MCKNAKTNGELPNDVRDIFPRSRQPGVPADKFTEFKQPWIAFRSVGLSQSIWMPLRFDIIDMERPKLFKLGKLSIITEVLPTRVEFHWTLIVTIRSAIWIAN